MERRGQSPRRVAALGILVTAAAMAAPATALASFHLTKIREVATGNASGGAFIELQAYSSGQNFLSGHPVTVYDGAGGSTTIPLSNVPNGQSQRTVLIGDSLLPNGVTADVQVENLSTFMNKNAGAVCFDNLDCVAWGSFAGPVLPSPVGAPAAKIPNGNSITRSIAAGCSTLLEASDDTDVSSADFSVTKNPTPRSNSEAPLEKPCKGGGGSGKAPQTSIDKGPKKKTAKKTAKFKFSSPDNGATLECSLDGKDFKACDSPLKLKRVKPGKHVFSVRAVLDGKADKSPAEYRWKRVRKK